MTTEGKTIVGRCFCGSVEVAVQGDPLAMGYCHCGSCRSWSSAGECLYPLAAGRGACDQGIGQDRQPSEKRQ